MKHFFPLEQPKKLQQLTLIFLKLTIYRKLGKKVSKYNNSLKSWSKIFNSLSQPLLINTLNKNVKFGETRTKR